MRMHPSEDARAQLVVDMMSVMRVMSVMSVMPVMSVAVISDPSTG